MRIYRGTLTLHEHLYFASREMGILYATEPVIGNYALTYALGLCRAPYYWAGGPRYKQDLTPLNAAGIYVTPATFTAFSFAFQQFNAQTDTYYSRFDQNAIGTVRGQIARANNYPQNGKLRMIGMGSSAVLHVLSARDEALDLPRYVRLGKFNSKARIDWADVPASRSEERGAPSRLLLNAADLPPDAQLRILALHSVHPAPLISSALLFGPCYRLAPSTPTAQTTDMALLPIGLRYGVEGLP